MNLVINSVNLQLLYGNVTYAVLVTRAVKNIIMLPIDIALLSLVLPVAKYAYERTGKR